MYKFFFKRFLDFWISLIVLVCISPVLLVVTIWLHFANKGAGAFFFQERPGKDAKIFKVIKFKTMTDERDAEGNLLSDEVRLTKVGKFVRSTSIDELPQLINVLKGDMALIGPRPLLVQYLTLYSPEQARRHEVRPGISRFGAVSWAQCYFLDRKVQTGCVVCGSLFFVDGYQSDLDYRYEGPKARWHLSRGAGYYGSV